MRITIEAQDVESPRQVSIQVHDNSDIHDMVDDLCGLLIAYGFHPDSVEDGIIEKARCYEEAKIQDKAE